MPLQPAVCPNVIELAAKLGYKINDCSPDFGVVVTGNGINQKVTELHWIPSTAPLLSGNLDDPNWDALVDLKIIKMPNQNLNGSLPLFFRTSPTLTQIDLSGNKISGTLVNINNPSLTYVDLSDNLFTGSIPPLSSILSTLILNNNKLSGPIPPLSGTILTSINLSANMLSGSIPALPSTLTSLDLKVNALNGSIPLLTASLTFVNVARNQLIGSIPPLPLGLTIFTANNNGLTGPLPSFVGSNIISFTINNNQISGTIAPFPTAMTTFLAVNNYLSGSIPSVFSSVRNFQVSNNSLSGNVPNVPDGFLFLYLNDNAFNTVGTLGTGTTTSNCDISNNPIYYWLLPTWAGKCLLTNLLTTTTQPDSTTMTSAQATSTMSNLGTTHDQFSHFSSQKFTSDTSQAFQMKSASKSMLSFSTSSTDSTLTASSTYQTNMPFSQTLQSSKSTTTRPSTRSTTRNISGVGISFTSSNTNKLSRTSASSRIPIITNIQVLSKSRAISDPLTSITLNAPVPFESLLLSTMLTDVTLLDSNIETSQPTSATLATISDFPLFDESTSFISPVAMISVLFVLSLLIAGCFIEFCLRRSSKDKDDRRSLFKKETRKELFSIFETGKTGVLPPEEVKNPAYKVITVQKAREYPKK